MITKLARCYVHACNHACAYYILGQQGSSWWFSSVDYRCAQSLSSAVSWSLQKSWAAAASVACCYEKGCLQLSVRMARRYHQTPFSLKVTFSTSSALGPALPCLLATSPHWVTSPRSPGYSSRTNALAGSQIPVRIGRRWKKFHKHIPLCHPDWVFRVSGKARSNHWSRLYRHIRKHVGQDYYGDIGDNSCNCNLSYAVP